MGTIDNICGDEEKGYFPLGKWDMQGMQRNFFLLSMRGNMIQGMNTIRYATHIT
jgi:hypothetical protein